VARFGTITGKGKEREKPGKPLGVFLAVSLLVFAVLFEMSLRVTDQAIILDCCDARPMFALGH